MFDLAAYVVTGADGEVRRDADKFLVQFYHDELQRRLDAKGTKIELSVNALTEAYKLASIVKTQEAVCNATWLAKAGVDAVQDAKKAKLELRARLMLEDAVRYKEEVAVPFTERTSN